MAALLVRDRRHLNPLLPKQFLVHARDHALFLGASGRGAVSAPVGAFSATKFA
jgi:hypothetical protein